jgi:hypothetical protein
MHPRVNMRPTAMINTITDARRHCDRIRLDNERATHRKTRNGFKGTLP